MITELFLSPTDSILTPVWIAGVIHILLYYGYGLKVYLPFLKIKKMETGFRIITFLIILALFAITLLSIGIFMYQKKLIYAACIIISIIHLSFFIGMRQYPEFFRLYKKQVNDEKYKYSRLLSVDTKKIHRKLTRLMDKEKVFTDPDLTLKSLSEKISLTAHQLSQNLNEQLNLNFRNYINKHRIEEAKHLLTSPQKPNILNICYKVGFNSISAFNRAFKKYNNESPTDFWTRNFES